MNSKILISLISITLMISCEPKKQSEIADTATSGNINIAVDESFLPIADAEIAVMKNIYKYANINPEYTTEENAYNLLIKDHVRLIIATRLPNDNEQKYFDNIKLRPRITKIAEDGVALIINNSDNDTLISISQLKKILSGEIINYKKNNKDSIAIIFDNSNSSNLRFLSEKLGVKQPFKAKVFAAGSNEKVIDYVEKNKNCIGVIGTSWISDAEDAQSLKFLKRIKVMSVSEINAKNNENDYYLPFQAYIFEKKYPLWRSLYIISREARTGLGTGFAAFVASDRGQRIILKAGLVPATMPIRLVEVKKIN